LRVIKRGTEQDGYVLLQHRFVQEQPDQRQCDGIPLAALPGDLQSWLARNRTRPVCRSVKIPVLAVTAAIGTLLPILVSALAAAIGVNLLQNSAAFTA